MVLDYAQERYTITPVQTIGKINALYKAAAILDIAKVDVTLPYLTRIQVDKLDSDLMEYRFNSGFFYEFDADTLTDLLPIALSKSQTVTYYGLTKEQIIKFVTEDHPQGVDRFVPFGKSLDFTLVWDGYDLITTLSRIVQVI